MRIALFVLSDRPPRIGNPEHSDAEWLSRADVARNQWSGYAHCHAHWQ